MSRPVFLDKDEAAWLRQIDLYGDLMTVVPLDDKALGRVTESRPGRKDLVRYLGLGDYELTAAGREALRLYEDTRP